MIPINHHLDPLERSGIRLFTNLARQTPDCRMLTIGEPDLPTPEPIKQAAALALGQDRTHYAPNQGTDSLRRAIAEFETNRGRRTGPEEVLVTVGATQALYTALTGILNPGEEVIIPIPAFSLYDTIVTAAGGKSVFLDVSKTDFQLTEEALSAVLTPKTKAIVLNSPCNPTGVILNEKSLDAVEQAAAGREIYVICDNVYNQLVYAPCPDFTTRAALRGQIILCQSFSKPYAMTGWRVGYLVCPEALMERLLLLSAAEIAAVPTFIQAAAETALGVPVEPMRALYEKRRDDMCARLDRMGLTYPRPQGAFYVFPEISKFGIPSWEFCRRMIQEAGLAAVPGVCFGTEGYIRLSYCYGDEELKTGLDRLEKFIGNL
ncbi:MAG: aminotransferase class I/II-fold pyridoxal phosphate-dependent enzyme [Candidatus Faecousia sp.]|nr:aminotransferase class I/II-fold pyridoxal phosphate-dependent enzyme [Candidatus Faecousia sp.]